MRCPDLEDLEDLEDICCIREGLGSSAVRRRARRGVVPVAATRAQAELEARVAGPVSPRLDRLHGSVPVEVRLASRLLVAVVLDAVADGDADRAVRVLGHHLTGARPLSASAGGG